MMLKQLSEGLQCLEKNPALQLVNHLQMMDILMHMWGADPSWKGACWDSANFSPVFSGRLPLVPNSGSTEFGSKFSQ